MRKFLGFIIVLCIAFSVKGQDYSLAENYLDQGEYAKAESIFKKLMHGRGASNAEYLKGYLTALQEQEKYKEAEEVLRSFDSKTPNYPGINVQIGYNYALQNKDDLAEEYYEKAVKKVKENLNHTIKTGEDFQKRNLLDWAEKTYKTAIQEKSSPNYIIRLARVYGEQQKLKEMFATYLDLISENERYSYSVNQEFSKYIKPESDNEANQVLRKLLMKRLQEDPDLFYYETLSWLFIQENEFKKAFTQEKAIYKRSEDQNLNRIFQVAEAATEKDKFKIAQEILEFALTTSESENEQLKAHEKLMNVKIASASKKKFKSIEKDFEAILKEFGNEENTTKIQLAYADFLAFQQRNTQKGKELLKKLLDKNINRFQEAAIKMKYADILVAEEKFNQALVYYSQIKSLVKNSDLAQEALFKVAKTSYYKGDFDWAQTQLKILKQSTSELTANDAIALNLLIEENSSMDSTQTALKLFAKADLLSVQEKNEEALQTLKEILEDYKGEKIESEALFRTAKINEGLEKYETAEKAYLKILEYHENSVLADDTYYYLAELYRTKLDRPEEAMENYKKIIFNHPDSIFFVDARKKYRALRGDDIQ